MSSFLDIKFHTSSCMRQGTSISQLPNHPQIIQEKLKVLSTEGLLPVLKVIPGWLHTNHCLLTSW